MRAYDFAITAPNTHGSLADLADEMGREKINIEGLFVAESGKEVVIHVLTTDRAAITNAVKKVGYKVINETEVVLENVENRPGMLAEIVRPLADAKISLTTTYLATDGRLVLGCENISALESALKARPVTANR